MVAIRRRRGAVRAAGLLAVSLMLVGPPTTAEAAADVSGRQGVVTGDFGGSGFGGASVAISDGTLVIGSPVDDDAAENAGAVLVFNRTRRGWIETAKLTVSDAAPGDGLGQIVDLSGDTIVARSWAGDEGAVYVFTRTRTGWVESAKLTPPEGVTDFGFYAVAVSGDTIVVGTGSGVVYVYARTSDGWVPSAVLTGPEGAWNYGVETDVDGETIVVTDLDGAAFVYARHDGGWVETAVLTAEGSSGLGWDVAISGDIVVVSDIDAGDRGLATVFRRTGDVWTEEATLAPSDAESLPLGAWFGWGVAASGDTILVGGYGTGGFYVYKDTPIGWIETEKLTSPDGERFTNTNFAAADDTIAANNGMGTVYLFGT